MKRIIILSIFMLALVGTLLAQTPTRVTQQILEIEDGEILDIVTNTGNTHSPHYILRVQHIESDVTKGSDLGAVPTALKIAKVGNATVGYSVRAIFNQSLWPAVWPAGSHIKIMIWYTGSEENPSYVAPYPQYQYVEVTHEIPAGTTVITYDTPLIIPPFPVITPDVMIQGHFTTANWDLSDIVITTDPIVDEAAIVIDAITGEYTIEVPSGWTGVVTPTKAGYIITPASREYTNLTADIEDEDYAITKLVDPNVPVITFPAPGQIFTWEAEDVITITWDAPATGFTPEYYEVRFGDGGWTALADGIMSWTTDMLGEGTYSFNVRGVINTPRGKVSTPVRATLSSAFSNVAIKGAGEFASVEFEVVINVPGPTFDFPEGTPITTPEGLTIQVTTGAGMNNGTPGIIPGWNNPSLDMSDVIVIGWFDGSGTVTFTIDGLTVPYLAAYFGGDWHVWTVVGGSVTITVDFGAKAPVVILGSLLDPTLPVELSAFNAILTAQNFVKLSWTSESETNMLGYRVYRSETDNQAESVMITPIMIEATNTSTTQHYGIEDREVSLGNTYYYWLEAVDYSHSTFYGYRAVEVVGEIVPELPVSSIMGNAYPNPFKASSSTNIAVSVKAGENATVTIYNVLGQVVKSYKVSEGNHTITWNGLDSKGKLCGSGIYFYKLSSPSTNQTKKMVIVK